jgi:hypothetical protein
MLCSLDTVPVLGDGRVVDQVLRYELVGNVRVVSVPHFFDHPADGGLFRQGHVLLSHAPRH